MNRTHSGFTLIEILIVVVILGILAAMVIPRFTSATTDSVDTALRQDLQALQLQVQLYRAQHTNLLPGWNGTTIDPDLFAVQMLGKTTATGGSGGDLGPYLLQLPENPYAASGKRNVVLGGAGAPPEGAESSCGWWIDTTNAKVYASHDANL